MKCPHCLKKKAQKDMDQVEIRVAGNILNVTVCGPCKTNLEKIMGYARAFPAASKPAAPAAKSARPARQARRAPAKRPASTRPASAPDPAKFDRFALSPEEIARTQALRPTVRMPDSPLKRQLDDIDKINTGERVRVFCMAGSPKMRANREKKILAEAKSKLSRENVRCIKDDGFEAVFEAA